MVDIAGIVDTISAANRNDNMLNMLLEIEGMLDSLHMYAYKNWIKGEVIRGPAIDRYWVSIELMYSSTTMPDPDAALRLINHGCEVSMVKKTLKSNIKIKNQSSLTIDIKRKQYKPKTKTSPVWVVTIKVPRHMLTTYNAQAIAAATDAEMQDVVDGYDEELDIERNTK